MIRPKASCSPSMEPMAVFSSRYQLPLHVGKYSRGCVLDYCPVWTALHDIQGSRTDTERFALRPRQRDIQPYLVVRHPRHQPAARSRLQFDKSVSSHRFQSSRKVLLSQDPVHFIPEVLKRLGRILVLVWPDRPQPKSVVAPRPLPTAWASPIRHPVCVVKSDQPCPIRRVQRQRIAEAVRPSPRRLGPAKRREGSVPGALVHAQAGTAAAGSKVESLRDEAGWGSRPPA